MNNVQILLNLVIGIKNPTARKMYEEANETVEKWSNLVHVAFIKISSPCVCFPCLFVSYFLLYTSESKDDVYILPFKPWYN